MASRVRLSSEKFGDIKLKLVVPDKARTSLFSHHLWNSSIEVASMIEKGELIVRGKDVVELGAALVSIMTSLYGANKVCVTDSPGPEILEIIKDNLELNKASLEKAAAAALDTPPPEILVYGHAWGKLDEEVLQKFAHSFTVVIAADTLWRDCEHENLVKSILHFLVEGSEGRAFIVAGLHTCRKMVAGFFEMINSYGLEIEKIIERNVDGEEREWLKDRGAENPTERKKWLVIGTLRQKQKNED